MAKPNAITIEEYWSSLASFITLAGMYIALYVALVFLLLTICLDGEQQWLNGIIVFMIRAGKIEGASQRVQEDTIKFSVLWKVWVQVLLSL